MKSDIINIALAYLMLAIVQVSVMSDPCDSCGANANCVNGRCKCQTNYTGNPQFHCHQVGNLYCQLLNDPFLTTFANAKIHVHVLGATRFAQFVTRRSDTNQSCDFNLFAIMERIRGKFYPRSFEFVLKFPNVNVPSSTETLILRLESNRQTDGSIVWQYFISEQNPTALPLDQPISFNNCTIKLTVTTSRLVLAEIGCCGIQFGIRPYTADPSYVPGIFVKIDTDSNPTFNNWQSTNEPLCLDQGSFTFANIQTAQRLPDPVKAMTYHANINMAGWDYLNSLSDDRTLYVYLRSCKPIVRGELLDSAWLAFTNAPFINCINGNTGTNNKLYRFLINLMSYRCNHTYEGCEKAIAMILGACDVANHPFLQAYIDRDCE
ncbi:unnamed protein product [Lymnaea stagnalis]|uniref:Uncharacterized protein n=1 Tax=Lymnaea stagnalis TaxID=6523 RepID=A0AAV2IF90_LYMST